MSISYYKQRQDEMNREANVISDLNMGDGISWSGYSDVYAGTIIKKTATTIIVREDLAELINGEDLRFISGGFAAHCENQRDQEYTYNPNPNGRTVKLTLRQFVSHHNGETIYRWKVAGTKTRDSSGNVYPGRRKFHDYNF